jgi:hypothetical protein
MSVNLRGRAALAQALCLGLSTSWFLFRKLRFLRGKYVFLAGREKILKKKVWRT